MPVAWFAELTYGFTLAVTPSLSLKRPASVGLAVTPQLGMAPGPHNADAMALTVAPSLNFGAPHPATTALAVIPSMAMAGGEHYGGNTIGLTVSPSLTVDGVVSFEQSYELDFTPTIGMSADDVRWAAAFGLAVTPSLTMDSLGFSETAYALGVTPALGMTAKEHYTAGLPLAVTPTIGLAANEHYGGQAVGLSVTPTIGVAGGEHYGGNTIGLTVTPSVGMSGSGNNGSSNVPAAVTGSAVAAATSVAIPAHAVGDLIVIFAYNSSSASPPTVPAASGTVPAWTTIDANTGANTNGSRTAYFVATATNHTTGAWSGASGIIAVVITGPNATTPIGGHAESGSAASGTTGSYVSPSITMTSTAGASVLLYFYGDRQVTSWGTVPSGFTRQQATAASGGVCLNTKNSTTSDGSSTQTGSQTGSNGYRSAVIEVLD